MDKTESISLASDEHSMWEPLIETPSCSAWRKISPEGLPELRVRSHGKFEDLRLELEDLLATAASAVESQGLLGKALSIDIRPGEVLVTTQLISGEV